MNNFLTFDIEEWYHANFEGFDFSKYIGQKTNLEKNVDSLIELCSQYSVKSTCFVLGQVGENSPQIVKKLYNEGHEIASHGYGHQLVYNMNPDTFKSDLKKSCDILENITGDKIKGYRAPAWSVKKETLEWYYSVLEELGLEYSSSVYPAKTFLYGIPDFPEKIHYPLVKGKKVTILEIPGSVVNIMGKKVGFSGGFYLRIFPAWFINKNIKSKNLKGESVFVYLHPREIDKNGPRLILPFKERLIHYWGITGTKKKLNKIIHNFSQSFMLIRDFRDRN